MEFELKITNGMVFDGSGRGAIRCDIGIKDGCITKMGDLSAARAVKTVDASGLSVCPGFIDTHSHSDTYLLLEPSAASKIYQGITTEICGNCGASAAPLNMRLTINTANKARPCAYFNEIVTTSEIEPK